MKSNSLFDKANERLKEGQRRKDAKSLLGKNLLVVAKMYGDIMTTMALLHSTLFVVQ
jgi:hypothetical protein